MNSDITIEMMSGDLLLWRCLHSGPLTTDSIDRWKADSAISFSTYRTRNLPLLASLTRTYGSCAVLARKGDMVIGHLRFYPKAVWDMDGAGYLCLQQNPPAGPSDDFSHRNFPPIEGLDEKTLKVHCLQTAPAAVNESTKYQRRGIGTRMARKLIDWALENGWSGIEAEAFEDLPLIYEITGSAGHTFWEKLGFSIADRFPHPLLNDFSDFTAQLEEQALQAGIDSERAKDSIIMRLNINQ